MLLYSTILNTTPSLTKEKLIRLVIDWNQSSPHTENIIPDLQWNGETNIRFGREGLSLDITELDDILALRYEKKEADGAIWDTDFILNTGERKISIRLDRTYTNDAAMEDLKFATPYFVHFLIEGGYLEKDGLLSIDDRPYRIEEKTISILADIVNRKTKYGYPVIYVSRQFNDYTPVDVGKLSKRLKGVAHVLYEEDVALNTKIRTACHDQNDYRGNIGVYYPNGKYKRYMCHDGHNSRIVMAERIAKAVMNYANSQAVEPLYTWQGVNTAIMLATLERQKKRADDSEAAYQKAENEISAYADTFDQDTEKLKKRIEELERDNISLRGENLGLRSKLAQQEREPVICLGEEDELYPGEIREMVLDAVEHDLKKSPTGSRRADVYQDLLDNNIRENIPAKKRGEIKVLLKDYKTMDGATRRKLEQLGFTITSEGKHYRLTYYNDDRYNTTIAKTGSDWRGGKNDSSEIIKNMF